jgi:RNA polymerase sigma-70 factor, ECF subfamily
MDLEELLERCRRGEDLAWETLVRLYQGRIFGLCLHYVGNPDDARDVAQEVFVKVYRKLRSCPGAEYFLPWLLTICRNACLDHLRRRKARPQTTEIEKIRFARVKERNPEEQALADSRKGLLYRALQKLTRMNREILLLKEIQGLSLEEISTMLRIPLGTAKSRSHRARLELAEQLLNMRETDGSLSAEG